MMKHHVGRAPESPPFWSMLACPALTYRLAIICVSYRGYLNFKLDFDNVRLSPDHILGEEGRGLELSGKWLGMGVSGLGPPAA